MSEIAMESQPIIRRRGRPAGSKGVAKKAIAIQDAQPSTQDAAPKPPIIQPVIEIQQPNISEAIEKAKAQAAAKQAARDAEIKKNAQNPAIVKNELRWVYNANTKNLSVLPNDFLLVDDGMFEYTPPKDMPVTDDTKAIHLELCDQRVGTKRIDGEANARLAMSNDFSKGFSLEPQTIEQAQDSVGLQGAI